MSSHPMLSGANRFDTGFPSASDNTFSSGFYSHFSSGGNSNSGSSQGNNLTSGLNFLSGYGSNAINLTGSNDNLLQMQQRRRLSASAYPFTSANDSTANEEAGSLLNLSSNTTTANNINSMLNGLINN
jgi:hypothetical protein